MRFTAQNLVAAIESLPRETWFEYPAAKTKTRIRVVAIEGPEGPITIQRYDPTTQQGGPNQKKIERISSNMIRRYANAIIEALPLNIDRILGASYNLRSGLEALLAHSPEFHLCYPGRIEPNKSSTMVAKGHKHLVWLPSRPHANGSVSTIKTDQTISEIPGKVTIYDAIQIPEGLIKSGTHIDVARRHIQMQIALVKIGQGLGFRTYIAKNDQSVEYNGKMLSEMDGVVTELRHEKIVSAWQDAIKAGRLLDCVWFQNSTLMPAVIEVEHTTGIDSGLSRMSEFSAHIPKFPTRYVVVAPDEDREKVILKSNKKQFKHLQTRFFPYSAVEELYDLISRRKPQGITENFLDCFMEPTMNLAN